MKLTVVNAKLITLVNLLVNLLLVKIASKRSAKKCNCEKNETAKHCWEGHSFSWHQKNVVFLW